MAGKYDALFTPMKIGGVTIKNRIIMAAMSGTGLIQTIYGDSKYNEKAEAFMMARVRGGVGLIIPGVTYLTDKWGGGGWIYENEEVFLGPIKDLMQKIHSYDCKLFLQLGCGFGRTLSILSGQKPDGLDLADAMKNTPSAIPNSWDPDQMHSPMTLEAIEATIEAAVKTAMLCQKADIDGVELHAVHEGYLLDQFSMSCTNFRTDQYGGSLENRLRITTRIIRGIKEACGEDFPVIVRYSVASKMRGFNSGALPGENYVEFGRSLEESPEVARILEAAGCDALDADNGSYDSWWWAHPPMYMPMACNLPESAYIKYFVNIPVISGGRMEDPDIACKAVEGTIIDGISIGRQFLADAEWCNKVQQERIDEIRPCIACHNGCLGRAYNGKSCSCALNPAAVNEEKYQIRPAEVKKKVMIVGGGIGGMEMARLCAMRGHDVALYEKNSELGGVFIAAAAPDFKEADKKLLDWYRSEMVRCNIRIHMNTEVSPGQIQQAVADVIVIATGARNRELAVNGIRQEHVMKAIDYLLGNKAVCGEDVVVVGGGLTGCEIAYDLGKQGKNVTLLELQDDILKVPGLSAANSLMLRELLAYHSVDVRINTRLGGISEQSVSVICGDKEEQLPASCVILSIGYVSQAPLAETFTKSDNIHVLGDAAHVGNLMDVIWSAYDLALQI